MNSSDEIKKVVKDKYAEIAVKNTGCGCGCNTNSNVVEFSMFQDDYSKFDGYVPEADLGLGCGAPTEFAGIKEGHTVLDLGSGAGNDVFVAHSLVGENGKVIGVDMTPEMIEKANKNKKKLGYQNIEFKLGEIDQLPINKEVIDVVISNCVLNLVPDKSAAFSEIYRVLKPGAHFCVSDIVIEGELPEGLQKSAEMYAGCVSGALQKNEYLKIIEANGFRDIEIKKSKAIEIPDEILKQYLDENEIAEFKKNNIGIFSITVVGYK
ncbi:MAG: methyltransferase domain-containing protein [Ignavibacteriales bacterium]|jgi:ubiquinone/menaquinone biosynthesis C-methylase UbiE|nr:MAG: methyltransferase domain-containing protein [Ignavibacteriales bacterium]